MRWAKLGEWMKGNRVHGVHRVQHGIGAGNSENGRTGWRITTKAKAAAPEERGRAENAAAQMQALLALLRLRQEQEQLRDQTSALEARKGGGLPGAGAGPGGGARGRCTTSWRRCSRIPPRSCRGPRAAGRAMADAAALLGKPETGKPTTRGADGRDESAGCGDRPAGREIRHEHGSRSWA